MYKKINVDFALNKILKKDDLFKGDYTIDPYQNCEFGCLYCDSSFEKRISIKDNIIKLLKMEIKNIPIKSNIIIGSVHDPYQKIEEKEKKTQEILKLIIENNFSCHILTKSNLILRDIELLKKIKKLKVTISLSSINKKNTSIFEKKIIKPKERLKLVRILNNNNIECGVALIPYMPFIIDNEIEEIFLKVKKAKSKFFIYKYLELKGDQKNIFFKIIKNNYPNFLVNYEKIYKNSYYPSEKYRKIIDEKMVRLKKIYGFK